MKALILPTHTWSPKRSAGSGEVMGFFRLTVKCMGSDLQDQGQSGITLGD